MKIVVYAIAKDEEATARAWAEAVREADEVIILDTGSTDKTPEIFREYGFKVFSDFNEPFRFDRARNHALSHVPADADFCFSVDIDEIFEPGWRAAIEAAARKNPEATQIKYPFIFTHRTDPKTGEEIPDQVFYKGNCHRRRGWKWTCPCHEVLISETTPIEATAEGCRLHHRSPAKPRRAMYLSLLEQGAKDEPQDARVHYYLGREYLGYGRYQEAADALVKYLDLIGQYCWHDEKGNAIYMIARACEGLGDLDRAESWALRALSETAGREPYIFLARIYHAQQRWWESRFYAEAALRITDNKAYFRDTNCYRAAPWDYLTASAFKLGDRDTAKKGAAKCLEFEPDNPRYKENARYFHLLPPKPAEKAETPEKFGADNHASESEISDGKTAISADTREELAVAYSITENFAGHLEVALYSLLKYNRVRDLYIIIEGGKKFEPISQLAAEFGVRRVIWLDLNKLLAEGLAENSPNIKPVCTPATLGRLFLARHTKEDKILYLDADTIVKGDLSPIWLQEMEGAALIGTIDRGALELWGDYTKTLTYGGIPGYLNAGVLLMNLDLIRRLNLDGQALDLLNANYYNFADQDVLNIVCKGRTRAIGNEFNSGRACGYSERAIIDHFVCYADFYKNPECRSFHETKRQLEEYKRSRGR